MTRIMKIITAIATLLTALVAASFVAYSLTIPHWELFFTCLALAGMFGFFLRSDYQYFFGQKKDVP